MHETPEQYLELLRDWSNPFYFSIIIGLILILVLIINYYGFYLPKKRRLILEKRKLALENQELAFKKKQLEFEHFKILADLSDTEPHPILRVKDSGSIIYLNNSATAIFKNRDSLYSILPVHAANLPGIINKSLQIQGKIKWEKRYFNFFLRGIASLEMAQLTLFDLTTRMNYARKLKIQKDKYKSLSLYLQENLEKEKQRIGMELHDSICQNLYFMKFSVNNFIDDSSNYKDHFSEFENILDNTISELKDIVFDLKPKLIEDLGLFNAIKVLSENICRLKLISGDVDYIGEIIRFNLDTELYLFRIIQEALNNIIKHSEASKYNIHFIYSELYLMIMISDNGKGFNAELVNMNRKHGFLNMNERIRTLNGTLRIRSSSEGSIIRIHIPYEKHKNYIMR